MTFIRAKEIPPRSGNWYDYLVKTVHEGDKVIQKHIRYIGKSSRGGVSRSGGSGGIMPAVASTPIAPAKLATIHKMKTPARQITTCNLGLERSWYGSNPGLSIFQLPAYSSLGRKPLRRRELLTTVIELAAMANAASIGLRKP